MNNNEFIGSQNFGMSRVMLTKDLIKKAEQEGIKIEYFDAKGEYERIKEYVKIKNVRLEDICKNK